MILLRDSCKCTKLPEKPIIPEKYVTIKEINAKREKLVVQ